MGLVVPMKQTGLKEIKEHYIAPPNYGKLLQRHGVYDDRLFCSRDKVTHTFITEDKEVVSLHFDKTKKAIFYNGRNILHEKLAAEKQHHFEYFREAMSKSEKTHGFLKSFDQVYASFLKQKL